ncbi:MAG: dihydroorotate dehydrogenase electron transfer subunit [Candidatus Omnitrophica bacterium]|nr:dihydroorotate dehydrogenase electron transfer subunit [Candidatus Omnitrophota bacterium]
MGSMSKANSPKELTVRVKKLNKIKADIFLLSFDSAYISKNSQPGQFLHVKIIKTILRRPFSIHCLKGKTVFILFRIRGRGTQILSKYKPGDKLNIIGPLGRGFCLNNKEGKNIILAGGLGVAPLVFLADELRKSKPLVILGAKDKNDSIGVDEFKKRGCKVYVATEDGSKGKKGTAVDILKSLSKKFNKSDKINIYTCGPEAMFVGIKKVIGNNKNINCQVSFEQFMGCGLGVCCGCTIETKHGYKKVCKDGPVFDIKDIW